MVDKSAFVVDDTATSLTIDGQAVSGEEQTLAVFDPATEELVASVPGASLQQAELAIAAARSAFDDGPWGRMKGTERSLLLHRFADALEGQLDRLIATIVTEVGTPISLAETLQVRTPITHLRFYAEAAARIPVNELGAHFDPVPSASVVGRRPVGVVSAITAYNYPMVLAISKIGASLAAGCTTVLMPSPLTPLTTLLIGAAAREAQLPPGVLNVIAGGTPVARLLTESPLVDKISFTGSTSVGQQVMSQAAKGLKGVMLELGGKSPMILMPGIGLQPINLSVHLRYMRNAGQGCMSPTRLLVHRPQFEEFVELSKSAYDQVAVGDTWDRKTDVGPLIRPEHRLSVEGFVEEACRDGAYVAAGGGRPPLEKGWYTNPALVVGAENSWRIAQEEIFGPIAVALPYDDVEDAVRIANDSKYGLAAFIFGEEEDAIAVAPHLRAGTVTINGGGGLRPDATLGGFKQSGVGREQGPWGIEEFLEPQHIQWAL